MPYKDIREFVDRLEREGELIRVKEELSPVHEISALFERLGKEENPAALVEKVKGHTVPVVGNLFATRKRCALALEMSEGNLQEEYDKRKKLSIPPKSVKEALVKQVVHKDDIDLSKILPVLTYHERDAGPYITQGFVFLKHPVTGIYSMGIHRLQVKDKAKLGVYLSAGNSLEILRMAEAKGQALEVAVVVGVDPCIMYAAAPFLPPGMD